VSTTSLNGFMSSTDKSKLDGVENGAQVNIATNLTQGTRDGTTVPITSSTGTGATLDAATPTLAGVMSSTDKSKLDNIDANANNYSHPSDGGGSLNNLSGDSVVSGITVNSDGHVTGTTTRNLEPSNIGAEPSFNKNSAFNKNFGNNVDTVCQGNDIRLSDARTPLPHTLDSHSDTSGYSNSDPLMDGSVSQGTSDKLSRQDHIHPSDTSRVPTSRTISTGNGLIGGGDLGDNRTLTMGTPGTLTPSTGNQVSEDSHTHQLDISAALGNFSEFNKTGVQSIPSSNLTLITWNSVLDDFGFWNSGQPDRFTVPGGINKIRVNLNVLMENLALNSFHYLQLLLNGNIIQENDKFGVLRFRNGGSSNVNFNIQSKIIEVSQGDYIETRIFQNSGGSRSLMTANTNIQLEVLT
jgi:hypothetical protein